MTNAGDFHNTWRRLPLATLDSIIGGGTCLVLAPHPDDESLGCGGLIASCCAAGRPPLIAILTDGTGSHPKSRTYPAERLRAVRMEEARTAVRVLGLPDDRPESRGYSPESRPDDRLVFLDEKDAAAPHAGAGFVAVVERLTALIRSEPCCTAILAPWRFDPHCDHEAAAKMAAEVAKRCLVRSIAYPVWGWTLPPDQPLPAQVGAGWRLDIAAFLPRKRQAIRSHQSQYGGLITDDPDGFQLPAGLLSAFDTPFETFIQP